MCWLACARAWWECLATDAWTHAHTHPFLPSFLMSGAATVVAVNSRFTAQVFKEAFARIASQHPNPAVIYPAINLDSFVPPKFEEGGGNKRGTSKGKGKGKQAFGGWVGSVLLVAVGDGSKLDAAIPSHLIRPMHPTHPHHHRRPHRLPQPLRAQEEYRARPGGLRPRAAAAPPCQG